MDLSSLAGDKRSLLGRIWSSLRTPFRWSAKGGGVRAVIICNIPAGNDSRISPVIFTNVRSVSEPREARNKRNGMNGKIGGGGKDRRKQSNSCSYFKSIAVKPRNNGCQGTNKFYLYLCYFQYIGDEKRTYKCTYMYWPTFQIHHRRVFTTFGSVIARCNCLRVCVRACISVCACLSVTVSLPMSDLIGTTHINDPRKNSETSQITAIINQWVIDLKNRFSFHISQMWTFVWWIERKPITSKTKKDKVKSYTRNER